MAILLYRRKEHFGFLRNFEREIDQWFGRDWFGEDLILDRFFTRRGKGVWTPVVDIEEKDGKYILKAELPGVRKEDIHVELKNGHLTLRGKRYLEHEDKKKNYRRIKRSYGSFESTFSLPEGVKEEDIHAQFKGGILELTIPAPENKKHKAIEVKVEK